MANEIQKKKWVNGVYGTEDYDLTGFTPITSPTDLYNICMAEFADLGMTDANIPGNATLDGLAQKIATQAQNDGILI